MEKLNHLDNTSGLGKDSVVPPEIKRWNWGAFLMNWVWGIGNSTMIALLMFIPLINFVIPFVLGAKGSEWAWRNRIWQDVEHFKRIQRRWAWAGLILLFVVFPGCVATPFVMLKNTEAYHLSLQEIQANEQLNSLLGEPIKAGVFVWGQVNISGAGGQAELSYAVSGSNAEGTAYVHALKRDGEWQLTRVIVDVPSQHTRVNVISQNQLNTI